MAYLRSQHTCPMQVRAGCELKAPTMRVFGPDQKTLFVMVQAFVTLLKIESAIPSLERLIKVKWVPNRGKYTDGVSWTPK